MTTDQIKDRLQAKPFVPFTIRHADGRETKVTHPEAVAYRGGRIAAYMHPDDRIEVIDLLLVSSLLVEPTNGGGTGGRKRRSKGG
jgi:hypothetical protein